MNLALDIGNTQIKVGWFDGATLRAQQRLTHLREVPSLVHSADTEAVIVSSVGGPLALAKLRIPTVFLSGTTPLPFVNTYATPATLGTDRIAAVAGAHRQYPNRNALVIDAGTCITYDLIDRHAHYRGGLISPGLRLRLQAMHTFTVRLPLVELADSPVELTARSTSEGLLGGAVWGAAAEISQMIRMYADKFSDLHVILCGGDAARLFNYVPQDLSVTVVPELILIGLNSILQYNVNQQS